MEISNTTRQIVINRDGTNCSKCGRKGIQEDWYGRVRVVEKRKYKKFVRFDDFVWANRAMEFDHVKSKYNGGRGFVENVQILCRKCNRSKGKK